MLKTLAFLSSKKNIQTTLVVSDDYKKYFEKIWADKNRFEQIFLNFISNSIKFTGQGGKIEVLLYVKRLSRSQAATKEQEPKQMSKEANLELPISEKQSEVSEDERSLTAYNTFVI